MLINSQIALSLVYSNEPKYYSMPLSATFESYMTSSRCMPSTNLPRNALIDNGVCYSRYSLKSCNRYSIKDSFADACTSEVALELSICYFSGAKMPRYMSKRHTVVISWSSMSISSISLSTLRRLISRRSEIELLITVISD